MRHSSLWGNRRQKLAGQTGSPSDFNTWCGFELFKIRCSILEDEEVMILKPTETIYGRLLNINVKDNYIIREWKSHSVCVLPGHRCVRQSSASEHRCSACTSHEPWHQPAEATTGNWERSGDVILTRASHRCQMIDNSSQVVLYLCVT